MLRLVKEEDLSRLTLSLECSMVCHRGMRYHLCYIFILLIMELLTFYLLAVLSVKVLFQNYKAH